VERLWKVMMKNQSIFVCEQCGGVALGFREERTDGIRCTQCDWSVATTYMSPIQLDRTIYEVRIDHGNYRDTQQVKAIAHVMGSNLLNARELLQSNRPIVFRRDASHVAQVRGSLVAAGLIVAIQPEFPW
jgi:hypothetical protein